MYQREDGYSYLVGLADDTSSPTKLEIVNVEPPSGSLTVCVVRSLERTLNVGQSVRFADQNGNLANDAEFVVSEIWRYNKKVDIVDPPHAAKLVLVERKSGRL